MTPIPDSIDRLDRLNIRWAFAAGILIGFVAVLVALCLALLFNR